MDEKTAERLMREGKVDNFVVSEDGKAHVKQPSGPEVSTNSWPTEAGNTK